jgi:uncharacterized protein (TIGR02453 family)
MLHSSTLKFLKDLRKNNNKEWFDSNRKTYEAARRDFESFVETVIKKLSRSDDSIKDLKPKDCIFRINRDIRFSKDKSPYKTNFGAYINRGGKKSKFGGYYFHCDPEQAFAGGGLWMPVPPELNKVRQEIDYCFDEFKKIINTKKFRENYGNLYQGDDMRLSLVPKGFDKSNPAAEYLKLKSFIAMKQLSTKDLTSNDLVNNTVKLFESLQPLIRFVNRAVEG